AEDLVHLTDVAVLVGDDRAELRALAASKLAGHLLHAIEVATRERRPCEERKRGREARREVDGTSRAKLGRLRLAGGEGELPAKHRRGRRVGRLDRRRERSASTGGLRRASQDERARDAPERTQKLVLRAQERRRRCRREIRHERRERGERRTLR